MMSALLGCIADDFTGGTDLAGMLVKSGMRTVQMIGIPTEPLPESIDAVVIALKSRTAPVAEAIAESLAALRWLQAAGCCQVYFKYCSTFDSTPCGNIGPVAEALMDALGTGFTIACPAFPANQRTIYKGYLFVGDVLLNESGMRDHPLTPMTDGNLVRVLQQQTTRRVGLVDYAVVSKGAPAIVERFGTLRREGCGFAIVDALSNDDLLELGAACADLALVTAGSGLALGLPQNFRNQGVLAEDVSCSTATQRQVAVMREHHPAFQVLPADLAQSKDVVGAVLDWAGSRVTKEPVLIYATATPEAVKAAQADLGVERAGELVENALAAIAQGLVQRGVGQLIVAGGETSGAVVKALGVKGLRIGREIDPGVPWTTTLPDKGGRPLALALKSGNFGTPDFFLKAWSRLS
jgi:uncharacterized protein YgbK (DUF1537 family)